MINYSNGLNITQSRDIILINIIILNIVIYSTK